MILYFEDDSIKLYNANAFDFMHSQKDCSYDSIITDPPYTESMHKNARKNDSKKKEIVEGLDFESFTEEKQRNAFREMGRLTKSWVISTLAFEHSAAFYSSPPEGLEVKRIGVWVKNNPMPQISGDRPSHGWESIAYLHKAGKKSIWNGGGSHGNYVSNLAKPTGHPTPKPLSMISSFVERFTNPGDLILDPFAGGGDYFVSS